MPTSHVPFFLHRLVLVIALACSRTLFNIYMQSALYNLGPVGIHILPQKYFGTNFVRGLSTRHT